MTDIVERSKQCPAVCDCDGEPCLLYELRAEIERLLAALQAAETWLDAAYDDGPGRDAYDVVCRALEPKP